MNSEEQRNESAKEIISGVQPQFYHLGQIPSGERTAKRRFRAKWQLVTQLRQFLSPQSDR